MWSGKLIQEAQEGQYCSTSKAKIKQPRSLGWPCFSTYKVLKVLVSNYFEHVLKNVINNAFYQVSCAVFFLWLVLYIYINIFVILYWNIFMNKIEVIKECPTINDYEIFFSISKLLLSIMQAIPCLIWPYVSIKWKVLWPVAENLATKKATKNTKSPYLASGKYHMSG